MCVSEYVPVYAYVYAYVHMKVLLVILAHHQMCFFLCRAISVPQRLDPSAGNYPLLVILTVTFSCDVRIPVPIPMHTYVPIRIAIIIGVMITMPSIPLEI